MSVTPTMRFLSLLLLQWACLARLFTIDCNTIHSLVRLKVIMGQEGLNAGGDGREETQGEVTNTKDLLKELYGNLLL